MIAIPARNEADRLGSCLEALDRQENAPGPEILLLLNNCDDASEAVARAVAARSRCTIRIEHHMLPDGAGAGAARRLALDLAAERAGSGGVLLTTDADSVAPPDWLAENLECLRRADAVAGRAIIDPVEAALIPARLHEDDARECAYARLLDEIAATIDPDPHDPWPRHSEESGASIAVWADTYRRAGGMPDTPRGEDRAFFAALRGIGARIRHAPRISVTVSGRIVGRAEGGMADTMRRRLRCPDPYLDERLEPAADAARRAWLRAAGREMEADWARRLVRVEDVLWETQAAVRILEESKRFFFEKKNQKTFLTEGFQRLCL